MRKTKLAALAVCLGLFLSFSGCAADTKESASPDTAGKLIVSASFDAPAEFARAVGGDKAVVSTIVPDGMEPHDFEPKAQDIRVLNKAQLFIYNGLDLEAWAQEAAEASGNAALVSVNASEGIDTIDAVDEKENGRADPHTWLSLKCAEKQVENIADGFVKADPENAEYYRQNAEAYIQKLEALFEQYKPIFDAAPKKDFVTGHAAFAYLCRDFSIEQQSVEDVFANGEPSARRLVALIDYCRENGVKTVFAEQAASQEVSATLASEVGARIETIYTIESAEDGKSYLVRMDDNLRKIAASLNE
ncbi:MAG: metal ABC transporter solute-binding protein, Zn/Mn family [Oscillospiraceae bacterium]|jgi:zinc transport system substrate-binding protein